MPELPEVETIRRGLQKFALKKTIKKVHILCEKSFRGDAANVEGQEIIEFDRRGKALLIRLANDFTMMIHLRMTGQLIFVDRDEEDRFAAGHPDGGFVEKMPGRHTRVYFEFTDGTNLFFNDQRKFGFVTVLDKKSLAEDKFLQKLGPEPWFMEKEDFWQRIQKHAKSPIKAVILNQSVIAGVGNIYADEGCFRAKIFPGLLASELTRVESDALLAGLCEVMQDSIDSGGSTMKDYVRADGTKGSYLEKFAQVFRRDGDFCYDCGEEIKKTRVAGRGTHYCPRCQARGLMYLKDEREAVHYITPTGGPRRA